jgi:hypothetical protein
LSSGRAVGLKVPRLVKLSMVTALDETRVEIKIENILICRGVTQKNTTEIMAIQFASTVA